MIKVINRLHLYSWHCIGVCPVAAQVRLEAETGFDTQQMVNTACTTSQSVGILSDERRAPKGSFRRQVKRLGQKAPPVEFSPEQPSPSTHL